MLHSLFIMLKIDTVCTINKISIVFSKFSFSFFQKVQDFILEIKKSFVSYIIYGIYNIVKVYLSWNFMLFILVSNFNSIYSFLDAIFKNVFLIQIMSKNEIYPYIAIFLIFAYTIFGVNFISSSDSKAYLFLRYFKLNPNHYYKVNHLKFIFSLILIILNIKLYFNYITWNDLLFIFLFAASFYTILKLTYLKRYQKQQCLEKDNFPLIMILICLLILILCITIRLPIYNFVNVFTFTIVFLMFIILNFQFLNDNSYSDYANQIITIYNLKQSNKNIESSTKNIFKYELQGISYQEVKTNKKSIDYFFEIFKHRFKKKNSKFYFSVLWRMILLFGIAMTVTNGLPNFNYNQSFVFSVLTFMGIVYYNVLSISVLNLNTYFNFDIYLKKQNLFLAHRKKLVAIKMKFYTSYLLIPIILTLIIVLFLLKSSIHSLASMMIFIILNMILLFFIISTSILEVYVFDPYIEDITLYRKGYRLINFIKFVILCVVLFLNIQIPGLIFVGYGLYYIFLRYSINQKN